MAQQSNGVLMALCGTVKVEIKCLPGFAKYQIWAWIGIYVVAEYL